jgi:hypothetical protein
MFAVLLQDLKAMRVARFAGAADKDKTKSAKDKVDGREDKTKPKMGGREGKAKPKVDKKRELDEDRRRGVGRKRNASSEDEGDGGVPDAAKASPPKLSKAEFQKLLEENWVEVPKLLRWDCTVNMVTAKAAFSHFGVNGAKIQANACSGEMKIGDPVSVAAVNSPPAPWKLLPGTVAAVSEKYCAFMVRLHGPELHMISFERWFFWDTPTYLYKRGHCFDHVSEETKALYLALP